MATNPRPMYTATPLAVLHTPKFETGEADPFTLEVSKMTISHNAFIRGFNSIYQQALCLPPADEAQLYLMTVVFLDRGMINYLIPTGVWACPGYHDDLERSKSYLLEEDAGSSPSKLIAVMDSLKDLPHSPLNAEPVAVC
ncbi:hypothetical protein SLS62_002267 [Diatrype stigma]|uniref:Uncharacterized protein n=1 Tax=Diatrype stigma TaxID=117547 RepID=A0AAN9UY17_9PEZI